MKKVISAHFLPSHTERKRAKLLRHDALFYYLSFVFLLLFGIRFATIKAPGVLGYASSINVYDLLKYTNELRVEKGLSELTLNSDLSTAASDKAEDMFKKDYWAHVSPTGTEPWYFFNKAGYDYIYAGENLAKNFNDSKSVVNAWMNSRSHRENLLNPNYTEIGFSVVNGELSGYKTTLVVQFFGSRKGSAPVALSKSKNTPNVLANKSVGANTLPATVNAPIVDVAVLTKTVSVILGLFLLLMFILDIWYSRTKGVVKLNGHSLAHVLMLVMLIVCLGFLIVPGRIF